MPRRTGVRHPQSRRVIATVIAERDDEHLCVIAVSAVWATALACSLLDFLKRRAAIPRFIPSFQRTGTNSSGMMDTKVQATDVNGRTGRLAQVS